MRLWLSASLERFRSSLFLVPMLSVLAAIALAVLGIEADARVAPGADDLPLGLTSTVDSARAVLSTVAGATITFAAISFSISLLIIQQASSQYSPRVVHTLFRDPFNKRVMGLVMGTFTYCLVVLRAVRTSVESESSAVVPHISVAIAVVLGIATILAIVAFIDHSAHSMDVSRILEDVQDEVLGQICSEWSPRGEGRAEPPPARPDDAAHVVRFDRNGWVQELDDAALLAAVPEGTTIWVQAFPGRYAVAGTPLCFLSEVPDDVEGTEVGILGAVSTGDTRTMQQDVSFGVRQLTDVALRALSPGVNDPTTAQDAIFHSAAVLAEMARWAPPDRVRRADGRRLVLLQAPDHAEMVHLAFAETRRAAADHPAVSIYLLEALDLVRESLDGSDVEMSAALADEARLVLAGCEMADLLPDDLAAVRRAHEKRFGSAVASPRPSESQS